MNLNVGSNARMSAQIPKNIQIPFELLRYSFSYMHVSRNWFRAVLFFLDTHSIREFLRNDVTNDSIITFSGASYSQKQSRVVKTRFTSSTYSADSRRVAFPTEVSTNHVAGSAPVACYSIFTQHYKIIFD